MRNAAKLVELLMQAGINAVEPGTRQCDAVAEIYSAQIHGTDAFGGEYTSLAACCQVAPVRLHHI